MTRPVRHASAAGFTVVETLIGLAILAIVSTGVYFSYANVLEIVQAAHYNSAALSIIESHVEMARNMRYEDIGVQGGVPQGKLQQVATVTVGGIPFELHTYVRNIDDPFDGTLGGSPNDTAPADYKIVQFQVTCEACSRYKIISMATYIAPKNLESASKNGNLFIRVFDAAGAPVPGATVHVTNASVVPAVDLTDTTNNDGLLQLVDIATSSVGYHITAQKTGYSSDQTYPPGSPPNPLQPDATVATQQLTIASLAIDRLSTLSVRARDQVCTPAEGFSFLMTGNKLIGTSPDTPRYSATHTTSASGTASLGDIGWDTYTLRPTDATRDIAGATASLSLAIDPATAHAMTWLVASRSGDALLVSVTDNAGNPLNDAVVRVTGTAYDQTRTTGRGSLTQTHWTPGSYTFASDFLDVSNPEQLTLLAANGSYASASLEWLESGTIDLGTSSVTFQDLQWNPGTQPAQTGADSLKFQVAANNDNATWTWVGPDGSPTTFFTTSGQAIPAFLASNQYFRYRAYLSTANDQVTPTLEDISLGFSSGCVPSGQAYFNGMGVGAFTVEITRSGYQPLTTTLSVDGAWTRTVLSLSP
ncbi:MAG: prepilin-type N-terminal cleavage/methylation domain-containing protein [Candidatus Yanofskybacteria bacterium]|nr:prepilin-type N-terminal cleavage/methylation domain-containing protein [Candidatus Yanofskybacteria bacterium]